MLGAQYGYRLLWVLVTSTAALIVFHEVGARMGVVALMPVMRRMARDPDVMGEHALGRPGRISTAVALAGVAASVVALGVLSVV